MEIINLPPGDVSGPSDDCIRIQELPDGRFSLEGAVLSLCGDADDGDSVSLIEGDPYPDYASAEAAGLAWASEQCVTRLHVSRSKGAELLP